MVHKSNESWAGYFKSVLNWFWRIIQESNDNIQVWSKQMQNGTKSSLDVCDHFTAHLLVIYNLELWVHSLFWWIADLCKLGRLHNKNKDFGRRRGQNAVQKDCKSRRAEDGNYVMDSQNILRNSIFLIYRFVQIFFREKGNTLLEGVCIRLTWHLHNHDMTYYECEGSFMHVCDNCH